MAATTSAKTMVDYRCPACNAPMIGKQDVTHVVRIPKIDHCKHCSTKVALDPKPCELGGRHWMLAEGEAERLGLEHDDHLNTPIDPQVVLKPRTETPVAEVAEKLLESVDPISTDGFAAARAKKEKFLANATPAQRLEYLDDPFFRMPVKEQVQTEKYYAARNNLDPNYVTATNVVEVHRERVAAEKTGRKTAVKVEVATEVEGAKVEKKVSGKKGFEIFGHSHTKITVWAGNQPDWTVADVQAMLKKLTGQDISILSIRTFFYAGRAGVKPTGNTTDEKTANGGRGPTVQLTADQIAVLCEAAGKTPKVEEPKKTAKKKSK